MFAGGWLLAIGILAVYLSAGVFNGTLTDYLPTLTWIALIGTAVESLPLKDIDNITVTLTAVILGHVWL